MASLVADYGESSHDSSEDSENDNNVDKLNTGLNERLPPPAFSDKIKNSVFVNPYLEAENAQFAVLEKHVKMVPQNNDTKGSKKVCWMFKKGKCRFGKKCKFSHMEDQSVKNNGTPELKELENICQIQDSTKIIDNLSEEENYSDEDECKKKRKKHLGLSQGLVPSIKVIKMYKKQKGERNK